MKNFYVTEICPDKSFMTLSDCKAFLRKTDYDTRRHFSETYILKCKERNGSINVVSLYFVNHHLSPRISEMRVTLPIAIKSEKGLSNYVSKWSKPIHLLNYIRLDEKDRPIFLHMA